MINFQQFHSTISNTHKYFMWTCTVFTLREWEIHASWILISAGIDRNYNVRERERGQTTTTKLGRPYRFSVLRLNRPVCTIYRFLSYFQFFAITGPNYRLVLGWTGRTSWSSPIFKTMLSLLMESSLHAGPFKLAWFTWLGD